MLKVLQLNKALREGLKELRGSFQALELRRLRQTYPHVGIPIDFFHGKELYEIMRAISRIESHENQRMITLAGLGSPGHPDDQYSETQRLLRDSLLLRNETGKAVIFVFRRNKKVYSLLAVLALAAHEGRSLIAVFTTDSIVRVYKFIQLEFVLWSKIYLVWLLGCPKIYTV